jgi:hypothetical protein
VLGGEPRGKKLERSKRKTQNLRIWGAIRPGTYPLEVSKEVQAIDKAVKLYAINAPRSRKTKSHSGNKLTIILPSSQGSWSAASECGLSVYVLFMEISHNSTIDQGAEDEPLIAGSG